MQPQSFSCANIHSTFKHTSSCILESEDDRHTQTERCIISLLLQHRLAQKQANSPSSTLTQSCEFLLPISPLYSSKTEANLGYFTFLQPPSPCSSFSLNNFPWTTQAIAYTEAKPSHIAIHFLFYINIQSFMNIRPIIQYFYPTLSLI